MTSVAKVLKTTAICTAITVFIATPALASMLVENYMTAEVGAIAPCFSKVGGADVGAHGNAVVAFDGAATQNRDADGNVVVTGGVELLEEKVTVTGMVGDRVTYTDVVRYQNDCAQPIDVQLTLQGVAGNWEDRAIKVYLSTQAATAPELDVTIPADVVAADSVNDPVYWDDSPLAVDAGAAAVLTNEETGVITLDTGEQLRGAVVISTGVGTAVADVASLDWTATAIRNTTPTP